MLCSRYTIIYVGMHKGNRSFVRSVYRVPVFHCSIGSVQFGFVWFGSMAKAMDAIKYARIHLPCVYA